MQLTIIVQTHRDFKRVRGGRRCQRRVWRSNRPDFDSVTSCPNHLAILKDVSADRLLTCPVDGVEKDNVVLAERTVAPVPAVKGRRKWYVTPVLPPVSMDMSSAVNITMNSIARINTLSWYPFPENLGCVFPMLSSPWRLPPGEH